MSVLHSALPDLPTVTPEPSPGRAVPGLSPEDALALVSEAVAAAVQGQRAWLHAAGLPPVDVDDLVTVALLDALPVPGHACTTRHGG